MMCDCPVAGVITSRESYSSWIYFRECRTENGVADTLQSTEESRNVDQDISNMKILLDTLDPHLRPVTPDYNDPNSVALMEEHVELAKEYWKVQTELVLMTQKKNKLLPLKEECERSKRHLKELKEERKSLELARTLLNEQRQMSAGHHQGNSSRNPGDGWVIIPRENQS